MTNIQAIDLLKDLEQRLDDYCELNDEGKTVFRMAIEALEVFGNSEQLPSAQRDHIAEVSKKVDSDLISRQAAITAIQKAYADTEGGTDKCAVWKNVGLTNALHIMQDLPSARSIEAQKAYYLGMIDGVKECTARVKKVNEEINNARTKE